MAGGGLCRESNAAVRNVLYVLRTAGSTKYSLLVLCAKADMKDTGITSRTETRPDLGEDGWQTGPHPSPFLAGLVVG